MRAPTNESFDPSAESYANYLDTMRGYVRTEVVHANLRLFLPQTAALVVDIGGGTGVDTFWAAKLGHDVELYDASPTMLEIATTELAEQPETVADLVYLEKATDEQVAQKLGEDYADVVLSHGVMMYLESPERHIELLARIAGSGLVSLLTKGYDALEKRLTLESDTQAVEYLKETHQWKQNNLGHTVWAHQPEEIVEMFDEVGFEVVDWFGVRLLSDGDHRKVAELPEDERRRILFEEVRASRDANRKRGGQMLHFIARQRN